jgi:hypothetical protein
MQIGNPMFVFIYYRYTKTCWVVWLTQLLGCRCWVFFEKSQDGWLMRYKDMTQQVRSEDWRRSLVGAWLSTCVKFIPVLLYSYHMLRLNIFTFV